MNIKIDENMPVGLVPILTSMGHNVDTVPSEGCQGCDDDTVWVAAQESGRFLITQDLDFSDLRRFAFSDHQGVLLVRLRDPGRQALISRVAALFQAEDVESWRGCFVVTTEHKLRVRRAGPS